MSDNVNLNSQINQSNTQNIDSAHVESDNVPNTGTNIQPNNSQVQSTPENQVDETNLAQRAVDTTGQTDDTDEKIAQIIQEICDIDQEIEDISGKIAAVNQKIDKEKENYSGIKAMFGNLQKQFNEQKQILHDELSQKESTVQRLQTLQEEYGRSFLLLNNPEQTKGFLSNKENLQKIGNLYRRLWECEDQNKLEQLRNTFGNFLGAFFQSVPSSNKNELEAARNALNEYISGLSNQFGENEEILKRCVDCFYRIFHNVRVVNSDFLPNSEKSVRDMNGMLDSIESSIPSVEAQVEEFSNRFLELIVEKATLSENLNKLQAKRDKLSKSLE